MKPVDPWLDLSHVANSALSSRTIEWFGGGGFSHVDIVVPDWYCDAHDLPRGSLLGARSDRIGGQPAGVYIRPPGYESWPKRLVLRVPCGQNQALHAFEWAAKQIKSPYDTPGLLSSFVLGRDWREEGAWWCSELAVRMLEVGHIIQELPLPYWKITPGDSALICSAAGGSPVLSVGMEKLAA
jgi:hypothetical protein